MQVLRKFIRGIDKRLKSRGFDPRIFGGSNPPTPVVVTILLKNGGRVSKYTEQTDRVAVACGKVCWFKVNPYWVFLRKRGKHRTI